ncbi:MAG: RNA polymerase sigma factor [Polyangiaceae bacterium]|nr:RNA polymerase sigma factor [Polyangiaceae bacterium]
MASTSDLSGSVPVLAAESTIELATDQFGESVPESVPESPSQQHQDVQLVRLIAAGDSKACRVFVDRYLGSIVSFAYRMLGDVSEAEDVAQETCLRLWNNASRWEPRAKLGTWLHHVARNLCIDRLRASRSTVFGDEMELVDSRPGVQSLLDNKLREKAVQLALLKLGERQRAAIVLVYYQGLSNKEAAVVMGVEVDGLESLLSRGRRSLRDLLISDGQMDVERPQNRDKRKSPTKARA